MINHVYQLVAPGVFSVKYEDLRLRNQVLVRPTYMAICHADQRYYQGLRDGETLKRKLPMALIHECCGEVLRDPSGALNVGDQVVLIPNIPGPDLPEIYENYALGSAFRSSGIDGFLQEVVAMPADRLVSCPGVPPQTSAISEFLSVACHALERFFALAHKIREKLVVFGDGALAYSLACVLKTTMPSAHLTVVGKSVQKLSYFSFADQTLLFDEVPKNFDFDHAFECCGGEGSYFAIEKIIRHIRPQGTCVLLGVSENSVPINTRDTLEKGLTFVGCSRSGRENFEHAVGLLQNKNFCARIGAIIFEDQPVRSIADIHRAFKTDLATMFKTVFAWKI